MLDMNGKIKGPFTCYWYEFTKDKPTKYVDRRDAEVLLTLKKVDGRNLFDGSLS